MTVNKDDTQTKKDSPNEHENLAHSRKVDRLTANESQRTDTPSQNDQPPILILVNPHSGRGQSVKIFRKCVSKILESHNVEHEIFVTSADLRVKQYLQSKQLDELLKYRAIMVVSGDGLLYETVNALMARSDWQRAIQIPIGVVPTGSGNGMAYTLLHTSRMLVKNQTEAVRLCCEQVIQAKKRPCDLVRLRFGHDTIWSFLSIGWGLLADIDIDSEWLRCLGEFRFTIYGVLRSLTSVSYRGKLSYKLEANERQSTKLEPISEFRSDRNLDNDCNSSRQDKGLEHQEEFDGWTHIEDKFACLYAVHQPYVNSATRFAPRSSLSDHLTYLTYIRGSLNIYQVIEFLLAIEDGSHEKLSYVTVVPVKSFRFQPLQPSKVVVDGEVISWTVANGPISCTVVPEVFNLAWSTHDETRPDS